MNPMLGMIFLWPVSFVPEGFRLCDGSKLPIQEYQALYSLIGNTYGGDGKKDFALPNLAGQFVRGSAMSSQRVMNAQTGGSETITIGMVNMPAHTHEATWTAGKPGAWENSTPASASLMVSTASGTSTDPTNCYLAGAALPPPDAFSSPTPVPSFIDAASADGTLVPIQGLSVDNGTASLPTAQNGTVIVKPSGAGQPLLALPPYVTMAYIICVSGGEYPIQPE